MAWSQQVELRLPHFGWKYDPGMLRLSGVSGGESTSSYMLKMGLLGTPVTEQVVTSSHLCHQGVMDMPKTPLV